MVARIGLTFSLFLVLLCTAFAGPYKDLSEHLSKAKTSAERAKVLHCPLVEGDARLSALLAGKVKGDNAGPVGPDAVAQVIELRALAEDTPGRSKLQAAAAEIKRSPIYTDPGERDSTNWLGRALERLKNLHWKPKSPKMNGINPGIFGEWVIYAAWFLLGVAVLCFLLFAAKRIDFSRLKRTSKTKSVLEDDEPDRTLDEWLQLADELERQGKYREAVRSLYLACLLKIDEARIARFDRGQTNWEHLARIESSPRKPEAMDFRTPTKAFDLIWYGYQVNGSSDVDRFRGWYREIVDATRQVAA